MKIFNLDVYLLSAFKDNLFQFYFREITVSHRYCRYRTNFVYFLLEYFGAKPTKIIAYLHGIQTVNMEDSYLGMLHNNPYSYLSLCGQLCCGTQEPVAVEQGEASNDIVQVATASVGVEQNSRMKKATIQAVICRGNVVD